MSWTIKKAIQYMSNKEISPKELLDDIFKSIKSNNSKYNVYITITEEIAYNQLEQNEKKSDEEKSKCQLLNIPISIKDVICTKGIRTTAASKMLEEFVPQYNATVIDKLELSGYIITGKVNQDEFAMGASGETSYFGATKNPIDEQRVPGGSSSGSAVSVALDMCLASLGTDTGGSIRQPASMCGVVGIKPTYGRVSRYGVIPMASSFDQVGVFAKTVYDAALVLQNIAGFDEKDGTSAKIDVPNYIESILNTEKSGIKGITIGVPKEYFIEGIEEGVLQNIKQAIQIFKDLGANIIDVSLPHTKYALATYYILVPAEVSSNMARFTSTRYGYVPQEYSSFEDLASTARAIGFGDEVKRRILLGNYVLSAGYADKYYHKASKVRTLIKQDFINAFKQCDVILTPVSPTVAWKIGDKTDDPLKMYLSDIFTISVNLAGLPGISIPCGKAMPSDGNIAMPVNIQLIANHFEEEKLFNIGHIFDITVNNNE